MSSESTEARRYDLILRDIVSRCQLDLEQRGFQFDGRGAVDSLRWVRFGRRTRDATGRSGTLVLLVAHDQQARALVAESHFVDRVLQIQTPRQKRIYHYDQPQDEARVTCEMVSTLSAWSEAA